MPNVMVHCSIRSAVDNQEYHVSGNHDGDTLTFIDPSQDTHHLTWNKHILTYRKTGESIMEFVFDPSQPTSGTYQTMGQTLSFTIRTLHCHIAPGTIRLNYQLYQGNDRIGHTVLAVDYQQAKEE